MTDQMKNALKGTGGGLQSVSQNVGEMFAGQSDTRGPSQRKADTASSSLKEFANPNKGAATTEGTHVSAADQIKNQSAGNADHLDLGFRK